MRALLTPSPEFHLRFPHGSLFFLLGGVTSYHSVKILKQKSYWPIVKYRLSLEVYERWINSNDVVAMAFSFLELESELPTEYWVTHFWTLFSFLFFFDKWLFFLLIKHFLDYFVKQTGKINVNTGKNMWCACLTRVQIQRRLEIVASLLLSCSRFYLTLGDRIAAILWPKLVHGLSTPLLFWLPPIS